MQNEKYGFVYLWYDSKRKMFYLGSHWGTENDGYICSSTRMRNAYRRRPETFKRRIIKRIYTTRYDTLLFEEKCLRQIVLKNKKQKYYNKMFYTILDDWIDNIKKYEARKKTISERTREAMNRPEVKAKLLEAAKNKDTRSSDPEVREKRRQSMLQTMEKKFPKENRYNPPAFGSEEYVENMRQSCIHSWKQRSVEDLKQRNKKIKESLIKTKEHRSKIMSSYKWWNNGIRNTRAKDCPGSEWTLGKL